MLAPGAAAAGTQLAARGALVRVAGAGRATRSREQRSRACIIAAVATHFKELILVTTTTRTVRARCVELDQSRRDGSKSG